LSPHGSPESMAPVAPGVRSLVRSSYAIDVSHRETEFRNREFPNGVWEREVNIFRGSAMSLVPHRFLFRMLYPCLHVKQMPLTEKGLLLDLPQECRLDNFAAMDSQTNFADVRLAWNEFGLGLQVEVRGKQQLPVGNPDRPRGSDGVTLWLDTRDAR